MGGMALLVEFYNELPERVVGTPGTAPPGLGGGQSGRIPGGKARWRVALEGFKKQVIERYAEGTLLRILASSDDPQARRAAAFALGLAGTMASNPALARSLHDEDTVVPLLAAEAMWNIWFRADSAGHNHELEKLARQRDPHQALAGLDNLVGRAPLFAEAYNQRAIVSFRLERWERSLNDAEKALELNPHHFGAQAGMGHCYLRLRKQRAALKAFRAALRINPHLESIAEAIRSLEQALGE